MVNPYLAQLQNPTDHMPHEPTLEAHEQRLSDVENQLNQLVSQFTRLATKVNAGSPPNAASS